MLEETRILAVFHNEFTFPCIKCLVIWKISITPQFCFTLVFLFYGRIVDESKAQEVSSLGSKFPELKFIRYNHWSVG